MKETKTSFTGKETKTSKVMITDGIEKLSRPESYSVIYNNDTLCMPPGFYKPYLAVTRKRITTLLPISSKVAAELASIFGGWEG